jgi:DNA primase small subunit
MEAEQSSSNNQQEFSTDLLRVYYGRLFPYDTLFNWLSYGNDPTKDNNVIEKDFFARREFSFTIEDDIYIRYQSFRDCSELTSAIQKRQPHKIDIGAVFTLPPKDHNAVKAEAFKTVERELVFDIDMTDYDDIRTCCTGANICRRCWPYMTMAIKVIDEILREDFGYQHVLWIYSGRRGVHCWVCDESARSLPNEARAAVVEYMSVEADKKSKQGLVYPFHPMIRRAYNTLEPYFERYIADDSLGQGLLSSMDSCIRLLNTLPNEALRKEIYEQWVQDSDLTGAQRWQQLRDAASISLSGDKQVNAKRKRVNYAELEGWRVDLVLKHCYPRLDANVSKAQNHLLKSPFCVHPKTGRVCVPIDPRCADDFDPFHVPTVRSLCAQVPLPAIHSITLTRTHT